MFFGTVERPPRLSEFDFEIPDKLIAQHPSKNRDECKLMVVHKDTGEIQHKKFKDIYSFFNKGPKNKWQDDLDTNIKNEIEKKFSDLMKKLGYI